MPRHTITRAKYVAFIKELVLDPSRTESIRCGVYGIFATVLADPGDPEMRLFEEGEIPMKPVYIQVVG